MLIDHSEDVDVVASHSISRFEQIIPGLRNLETVACEHVCVIEQADGVVCDGEGVQMSVPHAGREILLGELREVDAAGEGVQVVVSRPVR